MIMNRLRMLLYLLFGASMISTVIAADSALSSLSVTLCGLISGVRTIVGVVAITLFLVGGIMYAIAHFLPASLDYRKTLMTWAQTMIVGGVIGLIIVILAQPLVTLIIDIGTGAAGSNVISKVNC